MAFDDKKLGVRFPTRNGKIIGTGPERVMLEATDGSANIKKRFQNNPDGSVTMLQTRNGFPEFTTIVPPVVESVVPYLESGQLEWSFPGDENPTRLDAAAWHFLDLDLDQDYLGYIKTDAEHLGNQIDGQVLAEGQDSLSVGATNSETTVLKKVVIGLYPASLFSGKMRRFIQAQYGAYEASGVFKLSAEFAGESTVLKYTNNGEMSIGLWAHDTPGIFTGSDGTWWLLRIIGGPEYQVLAYQLQLDSVGRRLREFYIQPTDAVFTEDVKSKLESYIFAHCTIDVSNPSIIGGFSGAVGASMAYGWHWKQDGTRASIVVHELLGAGVADYRWNATTMHIDVSYSPQSPVSATGFAIEYSEEVHGEWTDGWGVWNIFVPENENIASPLSLYSLAVDQVSVKPSFTFSDVSVYGYYKDDNWTPVTLSRSNGATGYAQSTNELFFLPAQEALPSNYQYSHNYAHSGVHYQSSDLSSSKEMTVSVDGSVFSGIDASGTFITLDMSYSGGSTIDNGNSFGPTTIGDGGVGFHGYPPGYDEYHVYAGSQGGSAGGGYIEYGPATREYWFYTGNRRNAWVLLVPACDCDAVYVATNNYDVAGSYASSLITGQSIVRIFGTHGEYVPFIESGHFGEFGGVTSGQVTVTGTAPPPAQSMFVTCFNGVISGQAGTPSASYSSLFNADKTYPYFDPGMYSYTSVDSRYVMSEGPKAPSSVMHNHRFVGWA